MIRPEAPLWRGMTRAELDAAYDNSAAVPESAALLADWTARSAALRAARPEYLGKVYGPRERNRIDLFRSGAADAPLLVFIHGGYWQRNAKETLSCMAEGPLACGFDVALPGYTLAPDATLTEIVGEIGTALRWLRREGPTLGFARTRMIVSGWSAGGHLAAMAMGMPEVDAGLAISGIFDVEPCRLNYLNEKLFLSAEEAVAMSPLRQLPARAGPLVLAYGANELPELQRQSQDYAAAWKQSGLKVSEQSLKYKNHFSILNDLMNENSKLAMLLSDMGRASRNNLGR